MYSDLNLYIRQVAPAELEAVILTHSSVADVGVIGVAHPEAGEVPRAFVVIRQEHKVTETELVKYVAGMEQYTQTRYNLCISLINFKKKLRIPPNINTTTVLNSIFKSTRLSKAQYV